MPGWQSHKAESMAASVKAVPVACVFRRELGALTWTLMDPKSMLLWKRLCPVYTQRELSKWPAEGWRYVRKKRQERSKGSGEMGVRWGIGLRTLRSLLAPTPTPDICVFLEWKELEGVMVNRVFPLWGKSQSNLLTVTIGSWGDNLKREMKTWKSHKETRRELSKGPLSCIEATVSFCFHWEHLATP